MDQQMTWQEAQSRLLAWAQAPRADAVRLRHALYSYTEQPLPAETPYPPFHVALNKGFAINHDYASKRLAQTAGAVRMRIMGRVPVGKARRGAPIVDRAFRASIGDFLPEWLDTIIDESAQPRVEGSEGLVFESVPEKYTDVMPAGSIIPRQEAIIGAPRRLGYPELTILAVQGNEEVHAFIKPITGLLIIGTPLHPWDADRTSRERMPDILTPLFQYILARWQFPFVSLGAHEEEWRDRITAASEQVDVLLLSGLIGSEEWSELSSFLESQLTVRIRGLKHPLGGQFLAGEGHGRWLFFLPYQPVFAMALYALLLHPFLFRLSGDPEGQLPYREGRLLEGAVIEVADDDIWVGEEKLTRDFAKPPELRLLKQISRATMATLARGNCLAIPRSISANPQPGDMVTVLRY